MRKKLRIKVDFSSPKFTRENKNNKQKKQIFWNDDEKHTIFYSHIKFLTRNNFSNLLTKQKPTKKNKQ